MSRYKFFFSSLNEIFPFESAHGIIFSDTKSLNIKWIETLDNIPIDGYLYQEIFNTLFKRFGDRLNSKLNRQFKLVFENSASNEIINNLKLSLCDEFLESIDGKITLGILNTKFAMKHSNATTEISSNFNLPTNNITDNLNQEIDPVQRNINMSHGLDDQIYDSIPPMNSTLTELNQRNESHGFDDRTYDLVPRINSTLTELNQMENNIVTNILDLNTNDPNQGDMDAINSTTSSSDDENSNEEANYTIPIICENDQIPQASSARSTISSLVSKMKRTFGQSVSESGNSLINENEYKRMKQSHAVSSHFQNIQNIINNLILDIEAIDISKDTVTNFKKLERELVNMNIPIQNINNYVRLEVQRKYSELTSLSQGALIGEIVGQIYHALKSLGMNDVDFI